MLEVKRSDGIRLVGSPPISPLTRRTIFLWTPFAKGASVSAMPLPTPDQIACLDRFERFAFRVCHEVNQRRRVKGLAHAYLRSVGASWVHLCTRNLLHTIGLEHVDNLRPDRGVVLVSNHRSFFDLYVIACVLLRHTQWVERMFFPVKATYFYQRIDGLLINLLAAALAMYPPILREPAKRQFNQFSVDVLTKLASVQGNIVGLHPEGTRNKDGDPYMLLPAQAGVGQVVHAARPIVLPAFVLGLSNDIISQVRSNFDGKGDPITIVFGPPVDLEELLDSPARLRTYKRISDRLRDEIMVLGRCERDLRCALARSPKSPRRESSSWTSNTTA